MLLSVLKINLAPFLQEEALHDNVMRNYILIEFYRYFHNHKLHNHTITNLQYSPTGPIPCIRIYWQLLLNDMTCKVYSPRENFVCSFPPVFFPFKEAFEAFSTEKGEKYHIMKCYLVWKPAKRHPFRRQEKSRNDGCPNVPCSLSLPHCFNVTLLKINLVPFLQEEALNDNVMRNCILINFGY